MSTYARVELDLPRVCLDAGITECCLEHYRDDSNHQSDLLLSFRMGDKWEAMPLTYEQAYKVKYILAGAYEKPFAECFIQRGTT